LPSVFQRCQTEYGHLQRSTEARYQNVEQAALEHFQVCDSGQALDFLEFLFETEPFIGNKRAVDAVNEILREEGVGYEFSPYVLNSSSLPNGGTRVEVVQTPQTIKVTNTLAHQLTAEPALQLLSSTLCKRANNEMLQAHELFRHGYFDKAIGTAGQALESVLKIICEKKGWAYRPTKDTLNSLLNIVKINGLISDFYVNVLQGSGTIRNNLGAHGTATTPYPPATEAQAAHMIGVTAANIVFLARLAGLS
jgi:hypothetical protein